MLVAGAKPRSRNSNFGVDGFAGDDVLKTGTWRAAVTEAEKTGVERFKGSGR